jgi:fatty-acyl-CoA synthase
MDRVGDTFRWKGETISTLEAAEALTSCVGVVDANVYGVPVGRYDGRAGMVALAIDDDFALEPFRECVHATLGSHERPLFVRFQHAIAVTSTFKQRKLELVRDGFDPSRTSDPIYFDDPRKAELVPVDDALFDEINAGAIRI